MLSISITSPSPQAGIGLAQPLSRRQNPRKAIAHPTIISIWLETMLLNSVFDKRLFAGQFLRPLSQAFPLQSSRSFCNFQTEFGDMEPNPLEGVWNQEVLDLPITPLSYQLSSFGLFLRFSSAASGLSWKL